MPYRKLLTDNWCCFVCWRCCCDARNIPSTCCHSSVYKCLTSVFRRSPLSATSRMSQASKSGCWIRFVVGVPVCSALCLLLCLIWCTQILCSFLCMAASRSRDQGGINAWSIFSLSIFLTAVKWLFTFNVLMIYSCQTFDVKVLSCSYCQESQFVGEAHWVSFSALTLLVGWQEGHPENQRFWFGTEYKHHRCGK